MLCSPCLTEGLSLFRVRCPTNWPAPTPIHPRCSQSVSQSPTRVDQLTVHARVSIAWVLVYLTFEKMLLSATERPS